MRKRSFLKKNHLNFSIPNGYSKSDEITKEISSNNNIKICHKCKLSYNKTNVVRLKAFCEFCELDEN